MFVAWYLHTKRKKCGFKRGRKRKTNAAALQKVKLGELGERGQRRLRLEGKLLKASCLFEPGHLYCRVRHKGLKGQYRRNNETKHFRMMRPEPRAPNSFVNEETQIAN